MRRQGIAVESRKYSTILVGWITTSYPGRYVCSVYTGCTLCFSVAGNTTQGLQAEQYLWQQLRPLNADVYVSLFKELILLQSSFSMLNALQIGVFADIAATRRTEANLPASPSYLYSYGLSANTMLASYGIRFDMVWLEKLSRQPMWYLSLIL